jgi:hypothetical protein
MKKTAWMFLFFAFCFFIYLSNREQSGNVKYLKIILGSSERFNDDEIKTATDTVLRKFMDFKGCSLIRLWYDEEKSIYEIKSYMKTGRGAKNGVLEQNVIILFSDFLTSKSSRSDGFNPGYNYTNWMWILVRNTETGEWKVDDWGY